MFKLFFAVTIIFIASCNNSKDTSPTTATQTTDNSKPKVHSWSDQDEKEFLAECVNNAKARVSDTAAYAHCKCVMEQLEQVFPSMDSAAAVLDTAMASKYAANCK